MQLTVIRAIERLLGLFSVLSPTGRGGFRIVRALHPQCGKPQSSREVTLPNGGLLNLNLGDYPDCTMAFGLYELETVRAIRKLLRPGDTFVDGGANIGYFSLIAAKCIGAEGRVHAFEPNSGNRTRLKANMELNALDSVVHIHPNALSKVSCQLELHAYTDRAANHGQVTSFPRAGHSTVVTKVDAVAIDEIRPEIRPHVVKLDVEGAELFALQGMQETIKRFKPALIIEFNPITFADAGICGLDIIDFLRALVPEYECHALRWPLKRINPTAEILAQLGEINLLFNVARLPDSA
jgi:FkbM family methyltransferase